VLFRSLLPFGGCAGGFLALGGFSLGWWSFGGCAVGWQSYGACALAWKAAVGALAVAREFALGTAACAVHFNDAVAQTFANGSLFFRYGQVLLRHLYWVNLLWIIPMILWWRLEKRRFSGASAAVPLPRPTARVERRRED
jgi:hypothetical protein